MEEYKKLLNQNRVQKQKEKRNNDFANNRKSKRSAAFEFNRDLGNCEDADVSDIIETTPKKPKKIKKLRNKENIRVWKDENKKPATPKSQPPPFIVGVVRHKIHSPPFLHEPINSISSKKKNLTPRPLAPRNYQFKPPSGIKKINFTPKKICNSPFRVKSWESTEKKPVYENITVRSKVSKEITESMMQNSIFNGIETKNESIDESPIFGRANVLARSKQMAKKLIDSPVSSNGKKLNSVKKQLYTNLSNELSPFDEEFEVAKNFDHPTVHTQDFCEEKIYSSITNTDFVLMDNNVKTSQLSRADTSKSAEKNDNNIESQQPDTKKSEVPKEASLKKLNLTFETSYTEYIPLPKIPGPIKNSFHITKVQQPFEFTNEIECIGEKIDVQEDETPSSAEHPCSPNSLTTSNISKCVTSSSSPKSRQSSDFSNKIGNYERKEDKKISYGNSDPEEMQKQNDQSLHASPKCVTENHDNIKHHDVETSENNSAKECRRKSLDNICIEHSDEQEEHTKKITDGSSNALSTTYCVKNIDVDTIESSFSVNTTNTGEERFFNDSQVKESELLEKQSRVDNISEKSIDNEQNTLDIGESMPEESKEQSKNIERICTKVTLMDEKYQTIDGNILSTAVILKSSDTDDANESNLANSENTSKEVLVGCSDDTCSSECSIIAKKNSDDNSMVDRDSIGSHENNEEVILTNNTTGIEFGVSENLSRISDISKNNLSNQRTDEESRRKTFVHHEISRKTVDINCAIDASKEVENQTEKVIDDSSNIVSAADMENIDVDTNEILISVSSANNDKERDKERISNNLSAEEFEMVQKQSQVLQPETVAGNHLEYQQNSTENFENKSDNFGEGCRISLANTCVKDTQELLDNSSQRVENSSIQCEALRVVEECGDIDSSSKPESAVTNNNVFNEKIRLSIVNDEKLEISEVQQCITQTESTAENLLENKHNHLEISDENSKEPSEKLLEISNIKDTSESVKRNISTYSDSGFKHNTFMDNHADDCVQDPDPVEQNANSENINTTLLKKQPQAQGAECILKNRASNEENNLETAKSFSKNFKDNRNLSENIYAKNKFDELENLVTRNNNSFGSSLALTVIMESSDIDSSKESLIVNNTVNNLGKSKEVLVDNVSAEELKESENHSLGLQGKKVISLNNTYTINISSSASSEENGIESNEKLENNDNIEDKIDDVSKTSLFSLRSNKNVSTSTNDSQEEVLNPSSNLIGVENEITTEAATIENDNAKNKDVSMQAVEKVISKPQADENKIINNSKEVEVPEKNIAVVKEKIVESCEYASSGSIKTMLSSTQLSSSIVIDDSVENIELPLNATVSKESENICHQQITAESSSVQNVSSKSSDASLQILNHEEIKYELYDKSENKKFINVFKTDRKSMTSPIKTFKVSFSNDVSQTSPEVTGSALVQKYLSEKNLSNEDSAVTQKSSLVRKVPSIIIDLADSPRSSMGDYKSPTLKNTCVRLSSNSDEVIDLVSDNEDDSSSVITRVLAKFGPSCNSTPKIKNKVPKVSPKKVPEIRISPDRKLNRSTEKMIYRNLPELVILPCQSCENPEATTENSKIDNMVDDKRIYSLRARKMIATPSPKKTPRKTPKKVNSTPLKIVPPVVLKESSPSEVASPGRVMNLRGRKIDVTPSPKKTSSKKKLNTVINASPHAAPLEIRPPELLKTSSETEAAVPSPVRVMSLRNRKINVSPSPQKRTPRGRKPKNI